MTSNRERFEEWYLAEFWEGSSGGRAMLKKEPCGGYTYVKPQELWKVWQAAQPAAGEPVYQWRFKQEKHWKECGQKTFEMYSKENNAVETRTLWTAPPAAAHGDEAVRKDAERYRWLCDGNGYFMEEESLCGHCNEKEEADKAIDAAMRAQGDGHD